MLRSPTSLVARYHLLVQVLASLARNSHEVEAVVQAVHQQAGALFPSQATLLALLQPNGDWRWELREEDQRFTQHVPFYPEGIMESVLYGDALSVSDIDAYLQDHPVRVRRMTRGPEVIPDIRQVDEQPGQPARSMLFVPLEIQGRRVGVLSIQSYEAGAFDSTDLEFLQLLAQHVAIALDNAALREELERLTRTDTLTGLLNRRAFYEDVSEAMRLARQEGLELNLVMLDVDGFKTINDTHGHQGGDAVLRTLARVLRQSLLAPDVAFRLSGDEFALLVWGPVARVGEASARLTQGLLAAAWLPGTGPLSLQGGTAQLLPEGGVNEWLSLADARMYDVKRRRTVGRTVNWGLDFDGGIEA
ncbi:sensor domain-containing diguanylate cyclase [Deinococcus humi]|uniref:Diguanylate cyclase (GGDEF)-like protein n=1 Tax=Deinococcus humi TaxID=662880 RepID=A0A7W8JZT4_9DEIO|nr:sensor domain-containing diguanylate cyclase [Deinococcus humi]MBB5366184.1 diguanylate cyclase (GGDEF)-like protein [Deinococcus humi]GGO40780.1 hypothetical protein GCM10008949_50640 [Deinococcus humi]